MREPGGHAQPGFLDQVGVEGIGLSGSDLGGVKIVPAYGFTDGFIADGYIEHGGYLPAAVWGIFDKVLVTE